ncbi:hypothetical protein K2173_000525 [Erythroxylum novogranatense]|uniref:Ty3 transposon capsid-like protein domain-containing protein n=1 Tax=Erythroxylum novogranatense TaxID=1862640 RepID=A0AAV8SXZ8_9ROSI|nr:hypothetical protein K2173_000525 [Erythroxylum novogranatense]
MGSNKERIELLEAGLGGLQNDVARMELGVNDKLKQIEEAIRGDLTEWFAKVDQFFEYQNIGEPQKIPLTSFHLGGEANHWWQWLRRTYQEEQLELTWKLFEEELWARFGPTDYEDFDEALSKIKQLGSLQGYQQEFEKLGNRVHGWSQKALIGTFIRRLKSEVAEGIGMFKPRTLKEAISLTRMRDEQLQRQNKVLRPGTRNTHESTSSAKTSTTTKFKKLSWDEMQQRRAQGLCFNCDEKFTPGHRCRSPRLLLLVGMATGRVWGGEIDNALPDEPEISLDALSSLNTQNTLRVLTCIGTQKLLVLIDNGSTHNFISEKLADHLQLPVTPTKEFGVRVANGESLRCQGRFNNVPISLQGEQAPLIQSVPTHTITKVAQDSSILAMCLQMPETSMTQQQLHPEMARLLDCYKDLFEEPSQLPPQRAIDHQITLKEGIEQINVRPYRYAYFQKAEIEKQVQDMLESGLIRPSTSPFSSPVLLVKKKMDLGAFVLITEH